MSNALKKKVLGRKKWLKRYLDLSDILVFMGNLKLPLKNK